MNDQSAGTAASQTLSPRERRKLEQILCGAREAFLAEGCGGTSVDEIARRAGISKATLYRYFPDKMALFSAVMCQAAGRQAAAVEAMGCGASCLGSLLHGLALEYLRFLVAPQVQDLYRTAVAESGRVPEVGRAFFENGPAAARRRLAPMLRDAAARGEIAVDDPEVAADQFFSLCRAGLFERTLFGVGPAPTEDEVVAHAQRAVETFLRAYRPAEAQ